MASLVDVVLIGARFFFFYRLPRPPLLFFLLYSRARPRAHSAAQRFRHASFQAGTYGEETKGV